MYNNVSDYQELFMGMKVRRKASLHRDYEGDCIDVPSHPFFMKILQKQVIMPTEYDLLVASTRKSEIVTVLVEPTKSSSDDELEVDFSNSFAYHVASDLVKEIQFEEVEEGIKTRILRK